MNFSEINPKPLNPGTYLSDLFNEKPFFVIKHNSKKSVVRSWIEAYCLINKFSTNDINPQYIAEYLTDTFSTLTSPYKNIKRLPRHSKITINSKGDLNLKNYDPFLSEYKCLSEENLHDQIRNKIIQKLNNLSISSSENIGLEHSSGLDSNSILGCLLKGNNINQKNIHTYSRRVNDEIEKINKLRELFNLKQENCHYSFHQSDLDEYELKKSIEILGFPSAISNDIQSLEIFKKNNCKYILSGLGGDQCLSNSGKNIIVDILNSGDFGLAKNWLGGYLPLVKYLIKTNNILVNVKLKLKNSKILENRFIEKFLSPEGKNLLGPYLYNNTNLPYYPKHFDSIKRALSSDWLSLRYEQEINLAKAYGIKKEFPLLDIDLILLVLKQNPIFFADDHFSGRKLLEKSMSLFLPEEIDYNKVGISNQNSSIYEDNNLKNLMIKTLNSNLDNQIELHPLTKKLFNTGSMYKIGEKLAYSDCNNIKEIRLFNSFFMKIKSLNFWFNFIDTYNLCGSKK